MNQQPPAPNVATNYTDVFDVTLSPYGAAFRFGVRGPVDPKSQQQTIELHTRIFMSMEHLKAMTFALCKEMLKYERTAGVEVRLPADVIRGLGVTLDDFRKFWYGWKDHKPFGPAALAELAGEVSKDGAEEAEEGEFPFLLANH